MIRFENVSKFYSTKQGRSYVYQDINLELPADKSIGVLGPNGAGKSTLIRMIGGADVPSRGQIITDKNISWPLGLQGGLQGVMSGRENVRFVARIHGYKETHMIEQQVAEFAEIGRYFDEPVKTYSNGMRARVAFGLSMAFDFDFDVLLIDELNAVGDANFRAKSEALMKSKMDKTKVIMVNHSVETLKKFCEAGLVVKGKTLHYFDCIDDAVEMYKESYATSN